MSHSDAEVLEGLRMGARPEVLAFAAAMEARLQDHDVERGDSWRSATVRDLLLCAQAKAVAAELYLDDPVATDKMLVDAANYLMMIREIVRARATATEEESIPCS